MTAMFGSIEALRDSYTSLVKGIGEWLPQVIVFEDWLLPSQDQYELWLMFGLPPALVETLLTMQLRFIDGRLRIALRFRDLPGSAQLVTTCLVCIWEFRQWTDSRWISMGRSSRRMTVALFTGIESLVATLRHSGHISEYYIKAFTKLADTHRRAFLVGGVASHLTDAVLCEVLEDNRLPLLLPVLDADVRMETEWVVSIKPSLWAVLGPLCNSTADSIRSECINVALTSACFMQMRLRPARQLPWSLIGDRSAEKLQDLKAAANRWAVFLAKSGS